ncbi:hypothetical protein O6H91_07G083400 [Diphasiastrum complanatum]|uniref:Uncharacterized protein n=1 Tax=Diphasiastrum complanatum TaxID=34168 RepID=A0ACC2D7F0_DIPCM|nr:hypothetical protein O6H91_07G083400 [Diphasiastrum complanatum]
MADYGRRSPSKRTRRDFEELAPRASYGSSRGGFPDVGRGYDDRSTGLGLRDFVQVPYMSNVGYSAAPGLGVSLTGAGGVSALGGAGNWALDDPALSARLAAYDTGLGGRPSAFGLNGAGLKSESGRSAASILPEDASATLFVDGLPADCSRREAAHIFRPFIGFKEVRVVHKDAKRGGGDKVVLCFVEFTDARCAATALEALQAVHFYMVGYMR